MGDGLLPSKDVGMTKVSFEWIKAQQKVHFKNKVKTLFLNFIVLSSMSELDITNIGH